MPMDMQYKWRFTTPGKALSVHMENYRKGGKVFDATLSLKKREINSHNLALVLVQFPLITMKVVAAIYYEALRLWVKKIPFVDHPKKEAPGSVKPT